MIEARDRDGGLHSVLLQNAETVKLVGTVAAAAPPTAHIDCGLVTHGSDSDSSSHLGVHSSQGSQEVGIDIVKGGRGWQTLSVASLQPGEPTSGALAYLLSHLCGGCSHLTPHVCSRHLNANTPSWCLYRRGFSALAPTSHSSTPYGDPNQGVHH